MGAQWLRYAFLVVAVSALSPAPLVSDQDCRGTGRIKKLKCVRAQGESSIRVTAVDQHGHPADGLWVDAKSQKFGREQSVQIDETGQGKLWLGRDRTYEIQAYGLLYGDDLSLRDVSVPVDCEFQVSVSVCRLPEPPVLIY